MSVQEHVDELKRVYCWAIRHHNMRVARAALAELHKVCGGYCTWERHTDGGRVA